MQPETTDNGLTVLVTFNKDLETCAELVLLPLV